MRAPRERSDPAAAPIGPTFRAGRMNEICSIPKRFRNVAKEKPRLREQFIMAAAAYLGAKVTPVERAPPYFSTLCFAGFSIGDPESEAPLA